MAARSMVAPATATLATSEELRIQAFTKKPPRKHKTEYPSADDHPRGPTPDPLS